MNFKNKILLCFFMTASMAAFSQETLTLPQAVNLAQQNNRGVKIKNLQKQEKLEKINEDKIKRLPVATVNSTYQYNVNVGQLTIDKGSIGALPLGANTVILLPPEDLNYDLGKHHNFNAGITLYQPITQQAKIKTGIKISENEVKINDAERRKIEIQIEEAVQKLYYGILINDKKIDEAKANLELEKIKLYDVESALLAGKTIALSKEGMQASVADKEQEILKLEIESDNYRTELKNLVQLPSENFVLDEDTDLSETSASVNPDLELANLNLEKAELSIKAAKQSNVPDVGIIGGYAYQLGNVIYPTHNPFIGVNLKWELQNILTNKSQEKQRKLLAEQARENILMTQENIDKEAEQAARKIEQYQKLIVVAQKTVSYRKGQLKVEMDRKAAGLNIKADILNAQAGLAKSQADLYAAQLAYELAVSDLKRIRGK